MHPGMIYWWKYARRHADWAAWAGCGASGAEHGCEPSYASAGRHGDYGGSAFGVRRPLRFLAFKLELNDAQVKELARILSEVKTERAQADVDSRRTVAGFADAVAGDAFDGAAAAEAAALRVKSAERLRDVVLTALGRIHAVLDTEQRAKLAYLIRTGALSL